MTTTYRPAGGTPPTQLDWLDRALAELADDVRGRRFAAAQRRIGECRRRLAALTDDSGGPS